MKKSLPLHPVSILFFFIAAFFLARGIGNAIRRDSNAKPATSSIELQKPFLKIGSDSISYLRTDKGTITDIHTLVSTPPNATLMVADVLVVDGNYTNSRAVFLPTHHGLKRGDAVEVQWIYRGTIAGGHHIPFIVEK